MQKKWFYQLAISYNSKSWFAWFVSIWIVWCINCFAVSKRVPKWGKAANCSRLKIEVNVLKLKTLVTHSTYIFQDKGHWTRDGCWWGGEEAREQGRVVDGAAVQLHHQISQHVQARQEAGVGNRNEHHHEAFFNTVSGNAPSLFDLLSPQLVVSDMKPNINRSCTTYL